LNWYFMFRVAKRWHKLLYIVFYSVPGGRLMRFHGLRAC
jgi:hypothetical protein